jgi:Icc-related predicted phosphoesterase
MKILITADLHYREHWLRWLIEQGANYDLICIAGDLLDMFKGEPRMEQARGVSRLLRELATVTRVAVCSGNHDNAGRQVNADRAPVYEWFHALRSEPNMITDGVTRVVGDLVVTTVPYHCSREQKSIWLERGAVIRKQRGSRWLVLHHVPPGGQAAASGEEAEAAAILMTYRPDFFVCGHTHAYPYLAGNSWAQKIGGADVIVPGQLLRAPFPNHIVLDTESGRASWETSSKVWVPEDGLYDHLVLKVTSPF